MLNVTVFVRKVSKTCMPKQLLLCGLVILCFFGASAKTYYLSSVSGSDSYTTTQAQSASTPWQSVSKLNSVFSSLVSGDSVLFKRGETFYGTLTPTVAGVIFAAYGSGAKPVLSGLTAITSWTSVGTNLWKSPAISSTSNPCVLTVGGVAMPYGRFPNTGYMYFESVSGTSSITDNQLTGTPNFTGGELVLRLNGFELNRHPISSHSGSTITFTGNSSTLKANYGYFIQNHLSALDRQNEWYFDNSTKTVTIWSTSTPANIKVSTINNVCLINRVNNLSFIGLAFEGGNTNTISITSSSGITIDGCDISNSGAAAVIAVSTSSSVFQNNKIYNSYDNAFDISNSANASITIRNNAIVKSGAVPGMGGSGSAMVMCGIGICGNNHVVENNTIDSTGFTPINFKRCNNISIKNNVINTYCFVKHDGGGVYTWNNETTPTTYTNNSIVGNIILNGIGAAAGTIDTTYFDVDGIMMDDNAANVTITDNTVSNVAGNGIYIHNNYNMTVLRNTVFNCGANQVNFTHNLAYINGSVSPYTTPLRNIIFKNNVLVAKTASQPVTVLYTMRNDIDSMGTIDSNYITRPINEDWTIEASRSINGSIVKNTYDLDTWKSSFKWDKASKKSARGIKPYTINSLATSNLVTYGDFASNISGLKYYSANGNNTLTWDNTSKLTGTGSLKIAFPSIVSSEYTLLYSSVGAVSSSKSYILRFSTLGTTDTGYLRVFIRREGSPYDYLTPLQFKRFGKTRIDHEYLFTAPTTASAAVYAIEIKQSSGTVYMDDIQFYEVNATVTNPDDNIRLEYNGTASAKTISLGGNYIGVDSTLYPGTITLQPFASKVLIRDTATKNSTPVSNINLTVTNNPVACFGGNSTVTVAASGGTSPYTGTGTYTVSAGKGSLRISFPSVVYNKYTLLYSAVGAISSSKNYMLRFTTLGTTDTGAVRAYIRQTASPYGNLTAVQTKSFGTQRTNHVFYFNAPTTDAGGSFVIEVKQSSGTTYLDNIEFFEINTAGRVVSNNLVTNGFFEDNINNITVWSENSNHTVAWDTSSKITANYTYTVKDATGATRDTLVTITQPAAALSVTATAGTIAIIGGNATVTVTATGGTSPYTGTGSFSVKAGTYTYTVTDAKGCTASTSVTLKDPIATPLSATAISTNIACFGGNASVIISASGGTAPYSGIGTYAVSAGTGTLKVSYTSPASGKYTKFYGAIGALGAGKNYMVRFSSMASATAALRAGFRMTNSPWTELVTLQTGTCTTTRTDHQFIFTNLAAQSAASFLIEVDQASGTLYLDNIAVFECTAAGVITSSNLFANGQFIEDISGLTVWTESSNHTAVWDNTSKITDTYYFTVTDAAASKATVIVPTSQPAALNVTATAGAITVNGGTTNIVVTASGGTSPYTGTGTFKVSAGTYTYVVTDANGCTVSVKVTVTQPSGSSSSTPSYTLTTTATPTAGGSISRSPSATSYTSGTVVTLTATASSGYIFTGWSGDVTGTATSATVTMNANKTVTANFALAYTLTTTATPTAGGSISRSPSATTYAAGTVVTLTATPADGYVFTGWSGDASGTAGSVSVTMSTNRSVTANFALAYTLTTNAAPTAGGTVSRNVTAASYTSGTSVTLTATAASGYVFTGWSGDASGTATSVTVNMNANKTVTANFALATYTLTTTATPTAGGSISRSPSATTYSSGTTVTLTATAASGYVFTGWSGDASGSSTSVTVTMNSNKAVTANFAVAYTLTTTATPTAGGSISRSPSAATYATGTVVTLTATPASGYIFTGWSGAASGTATTTTVTMSANRSVTANFALAYTLTTAATPAIGGTVTASPAAASYASGTTVTVTATPASGYAFTGWSGDATGTASTSTVTMSANRSVTANFQPLTSTLRIEDDTNNVTGLCGYEGTLSNNSGASNGKVVNLTNSTGRGVNWKVTVPSAGSYTLNWRYVNSSTSNTFVMKLLVNGVTITSAQGFPRTSGSTVFGNSTATVSLAAGINTIRLESTTASATADIDWMEITGFNPVAASCGAAARPAIQQVQAVDETSATYAKTGIYPNPASGQVHIGFVLNTAGRANIRIYFADGRLLQDLGTNNYTAGYQLVTHALRNTRPGMYNVVIRTENEKVQVYKLIVQ
jgi:uncharacterized repeat protein (TIGR02543 family)